MPTKSGMPNNSRDLMLARIRSSLQHAQHTSEQQPSDIPRTYRRSGTLSAEERLDLFVKRLHEYDATVTRTDSAGMADTIACMTAKPTSKNWIVADGFPAEWLPSSDSFLWEAQANIDNLNQCAGVLTICTVGIAMTGSIVLQHGPGEGKRQTSLLPDRHLCVIQASQVVETVPEAFDRLASAATHPLTFISGPSATADIEMTRIRGVHGPRQLDIILLSM